MVEIRILAVTGKILKIQMIFPKDASGPEMTKTLWMFWKYFPKQHIPEGLDETQILDWFNHQCQEKKSFQISAEMAAEFVLPQEQSVVIPPVQKTEKESLNETIRGFDAPTIKEILLKILQNQTNEISVQKTIRQYILGLEENIMKQTLFFQKLTQEVRVLAEYLEKIF